MAVVENSGQRKSLRRLEWGGRGDLGARALKVAWTVGSQQTSGMLGTATLTHSTSVQIRGDT